MEIVVSIGAKISEYTVAPLGRQLGYLFYYARNVENLNTQLQHLNDAQNRLQRRLQDAQNNCQVIEADVTTWLTTFGQISREANTFLNHPDHAKVVCSCGSPPHLMMRHRLSRKARKMSIQVHDLKEECKFDTIAYPPHLHTLSTTTATATTTTLAATLAATTTSATTATTAAATTTLAATTATKGYESFNSRRVILEGIMAAVRDGNRKRIGLHGMGGIGKTMLAEEIAKVAKEEELFSKVVITTISQAPNVKEIQQHIAEMLEMTIFSQNESIVRRAELLRMRLERDESKILLILDDIWKELNLEEIGIHDGCKILVTSRYLHVLRNSMGMAESDVFFIGALKSSEAINLFMKIIGDTKVENNAYYNDLALKIVDECGGLPIAIATVAHALKCNMDSLFIWEDALQRLRSSNFTGIEGMHDKVYKSIRLSYDFLGSHEEEAKLLLLLCALHKEDEEIQVEDLIRYSMGWRLLQDIYTMEDARNRVNSLVVKLKSHCLLLDGTSTSNEVKMHDVIRDVCITIGKEDHGHRMMSNILMYEDERLKASKAISFLDYDHFDNLPPELECPNLELLLLSSGSTFESIPDEFFKQTGLLKVLIMNRTWIGSLPSSFASLQNLRTLCLRGSSLEDIAVIGQLTNLKALDLSDSFSIQQLPKEIGALKHLQVLDLRECYKLRVIEANVISKLTQMEELYLPPEFKGWDKIINEEGGIRNASLMEIKSLQQLTALNLFVPSEHFLPEGLFSEKLERYHISIGVEYPSLSGDDVSSKWLGLSLSQLDQVYARELVSLMRRSECLSLAGSMSINNGDPSLVNEGFPRLKHLKFDDNDGVQCIINSTEVAFPCLESLRLGDLRSLDSIICHGGNKLPRGSFNELRKVKVGSCGRLKNLFPLCVAKLLHEILVYDCEMMEEIIVREDGDEVGHNIDDQSSSLQLRSLNLTFLPKLVQFYCSNHRAAEESDHPKPFFSETVCFPNLEALTMNGMNIEKLWPDQLIVSSTSYMQNLTTLEVEGCDSLKYVFSFSLAQKFVNLKSIEVWNCEAMEDIIRVVDQPGEEETTHHDHDHMEMIDLFPKLQSVELDGLSSLQRFCSATGSSSCMVFPLLSKLTIIGDCSEMKAQATTVSTQEPFFSKKVSFPKLEDLTMKETNIEKLWPDQLMISSSSSSFYMQNLTTLEVRSCNNLKYLFSFSLAQKFVNLKSIKVEDCEAMEDIIRVVDQPGEEETTHHHHDQMERIDLFPKLQSLELDGLSSLQRFCSATDSSSCMVFPLLSKLIIEKCPEMKAFVSCPTQPFYSEKVCFPNLEELSMWDMSIEKLLPDQLVVSSSPSSYMQNLTTLKVEMCHNLKYLFSSSVAQKFVNLKSIRVKDCEGMEDIIRVVDQPGEEETTHHDHDQMERIDLLPKLGSVELVGLSSLQTFCTATNSSLCMVFPLLSKLLIKDCSTMEEQATLSTQEPFFNKKVSFPKLEDLTMMGTNIEKLWPDQLMVSSSSSSYMQNLTTLELERCDNLKYVFSFSVAQKFVNLQSIRVKDCEAMEDIIRVVDQPGEEETTTHHDHDHMEMIDLFPKLQSVELDGVSSLQRFCSAEKISFPNLKELAVWQCNNLKSLLSSAMPRSLVQLEKLSISECEKMEEVIVMSDHDKEYSSSSSGGTNTKAIIPFQNLRYLELYSLPNFIRFCELGDYCIECPLLSELKIYGCPKLKELFMGDKRTSSSCAINTTDNNIIGEEMDRMVSAPNKQILFKHNNKVIFPMLKTLETDWSEGIKEIFEMSSNSIVLFPNLYTLELIYTSGDEPIGVPNLKLFLHKYHTIRTLILKGSFVNMSSDDELTTNNTTNATTTHLTSTPSTSSLEKLWITDADMLDHVFGVEPSSHSNTTILLLFPNLKEIGVRGCRRLQNFAPSFMCFPNLETLTIWGCHGLRYLLSSSTATTLVRLQRMEILDCDEMKEIIINHNGNEEQEKEENPRIVFQNLKKLWLRILPSLQSFFYSGNKVTMSIPNLKQLWISSCPKMRRFSDGIVDPSASLLKTIKVDGKTIDVERDDVNATLAKLFREDNNKNNNSNLGLRQQ